MINKETLYKKVKNKTLDYYFHHFKDKDYITSVKSKDGKIFPSIYFMIFGYPKNWGELKITNVDIVDNVRINVVLTINKKYKEVEKGEELDKYRINVQEN